MYTYSIMRLNMDHFDAICADIKDQYLRDISTCPLFCMTLVPEGEPVWDKVSRMCEQYARFRDVLEPQGIPTGVLIQASIGHGYELIRAPFQNVINFSDGEETYYYCPEDPDFLDHFSEVVRRIAMEHPKAIMLDDDIRLLMRPGHGCACPRHMAEFNRRTGRNMTRQQLWDYVMEHPDNDPLTMEYVKTQQDSLVKGVTRFREAVDSIDPTIQGINCTSGHECDTVIYTNPIFAGKGNPTIVRVPNGTYAPITTRGFSDIMCRAAVCRSKLRNHGIEVILAETDTVPFNRYAKNARYLHAHYTASVLEGLKGAKHWLTRSCWEPDSGKEFRDILANHSRMYRRLSEMADEIRWVGCNSAFIEQNVHVFHGENSRMYHENAWASCVLERMGLPFYFSDTHHGAAFLESDIVRDMTDEQILALFEGSVFASGQAAEDLVRRGYGHLLGVDVQPWLDGIVSGETLDGTADQCCTKQKNLKLLRPVDPAVEVLSHNYLQERGSLKLLAPAVTKLRRGEGKLSVVFCGEPKADFKYTEGFAFLNESRKKQLIRLLKEAGALPVYYPGDNEICLRAGFLADGTLLTALFDIGFDPMEELPLYLEQEPASISLLQPEGTEAPLVWTAEGENIYRIQTRVEPMYPAILLIR